MRSQLYRIRPTVPIGQPSSIICFFFSFSILSLFILFAGYAIVVHTPCKCVLYFLRFFALPVCAMCAAEAAAEAATEAAAFAISRLTLTALVLRHTHTQSCAFLLLFSISGSAWQREFATSPQIRRERGEWGESVEHPHRHRHRQTRAEIVGDCLH